MSIPLPKNIGRSAPQPATRVSSKDDKKLDRDDVGYILRRHLIPQHYNDPNVMKFIAEYILCRDVKQAALAAGISKRDGNNLRKRNDIHEAIRKITEVACLKHGYDAAEVVERVKEIMNVDPADFENEDGSYKTSLKDIPPDARRAIKRFKVKNLFGFDPNGMPIKIGELIEVEYWDKMKAVELLGREKNIFKETKRVEHEITKDMSNILLESKRRAEDAVAEFKDVTPVEEVDGSDTSGV